MDAVEVRRPPLGRRPVLRLLRLDDPGPPALAAVLAEAEQVRDRRHEDAAAREVSVEPREHEPEAAALRRARVGEARAVHLGTRPEPVDSAVDAEQRGVVEVRLARLVDARLAVARHAARRGELRVLRLVGRLARLGRLRLRIAVDVHRERDAPSVAARPRRADARARHAHLDGERPLPLRHREPAPDAPPAGGGEAHPVVRALRVGLRGDLLQARVDGHRRVERLHRIRPEGVEVRRTRRARRDPLRLVGDAPDERRALPLVRLDLQALRAALHLEAQEAGNRLRRLQDERVLLREVDRPLRDLPAAEVVERRPERPGPQRRARGGVARRHGERRHLAAAVERVRVVRLHRERNLLRPGGGRQAAERAQPQHAHRHVASTSLSPPAQPRRYPGR